MKYPLSSEVIPQAKRAEINSKIIRLIQQGQADKISADAIFQAYTGVGGLHGLERENFDSFYAFTQAKQAIENGQFFTPADLCQQVMESIQVGDQDLVADLTCGSGHFFNFCPVESNLYGCELDPHSFQVASHLYPQATLVNGDILFYKTPLPMDWIVGNPPFNLYWEVAGERILSQFYFLQKAEECLLPGGILAFIAPESFLNDGFLQRTMLDFVETHFSFLGQAKLPINAFQSVGVKRFRTKVIYLQKKGPGMEPVTFQLGSYIPFDPTQIHQQVISPAVEWRKKNAPKIQLLQLNGDNHWSRSNDSLRPDNGFSFRLRKYLYEIKTHPALQPYRAKAYAYLTKFQTQVKPSDMNEKEWHKSRITEEKVLAYLRQLLAKQAGTKPAGYHISLSSRGLRFHAQDIQTSQALKKQGIVDLPWQTLVQHPTLLDSHPLASELRCFGKTIRRKTRQFQLCQTPIEATPVVASIQKFLAEWTFLTPKNTRASLTELQQLDLQRMLPRPYGILSWQQGSGKSIASLAAIQYYLTHTTIRHVFVVGPPIAIRNTWASLLERNKVPFTMVNKPSDLVMDQSKTVWLLPLTVLSKCERALREFIKIHSTNALLVFDESDEITNYQSQRSRITRDIFRRLRYKLLTTGTTTRNNLTELYGQIELLYNNSYNQLCDVPRVYREQTVKFIDGTSGVVIKDDENPYLGMPFPARGGVQLFKACYNPSRSTVFGIQKHNQDIYNADSLAQLVGRSIITRKFKEIAGDNRYQIHTHQLIAKPFESSLYTRILEELQTIMPQYYGSTGSSRKDAMLRIIRQLQLLMKSCSIPHLMEPTTQAPAKAGYILSLIRAHSDERIMVGCTGIKAATYYAAFLRAHTQREIFFITGASHDLKRRQAVVDAFKASNNGVLVCTQQSLSSSISIQECSRVILESLQYNFPRMEQFIYRCIRFDSLRPTHVHFIVYTNSIEVNLMALLTAKERLNDFVKTKELRAHQTVMKDFDLDDTFLDFLLQKVKETDGSIRYTWGKQAVQVS